MATHMTVLALDTEEKDALRGVHDAKRFTAMMKPVGENLRLGLSELKALASPQTIAEEDAHRGQALVVSLVGEIEKLPDSEAKEAQLVALGEAQEIFHAILNMNSDQN